MTPVESAPPAPPRSPRGLAVLAAAGRFLITAGVVMLLFVAFQLWGTGLQEARAQDGLRDEFDHTLAEAQARLGTPATTDDESGVADSSDSAPVEPTVPPVTLPGGIDPEIAEYFFPEDGDAVARIEMPTIGVDKIVVNGVQVADLRKGPGHYPGTALIGATGNSSIAGHRTTYGAPFNRIDELLPGDEIHVTGILGRFTYRVLEADAAFAARPDAADVDSVGAGHIIVAPSATWVLGEFGDDRLTLTACHPKLSSRQRIIVAAELTQAPAAVPAFDPALVAELTDGSDTPAALADETFDDGAFTDEALDDRIEDAATTPSDTLDEGLDGDRAAIPGAVAWLVAASTIWIVAGVISRRWFVDRGRRFAVRLGGLVPAAICLWFSFEMIDRALPAA